MNKLVSDVLVWLLPRTKLTFSWNYALHSKHCSQEVIVSSRNYSIHSSINKVRIACPLCIILFICMETFTCELIAHLLLLRSFCNSSVILQPGVPLYCHQTLPPHCSLPLLVCSAYEHCKSSTDPDRALLVICT